MAGQTTQTISDSAELVRVQIKTNPDTWKRFKIRALEEDTTAELLATKAIDAYLKSTKVR